MDPGGRTSTKPTADTQPDGVRAEDSPDSPKGGRPGLGWGCLRPGGLLALSGEGDILKRRKVWPGLQLPEPASRSRQFLPASLPTGAWGPPAQEGCPRPGPRNPREDGSPAGPRGRRDAAEGRAGASTAARSQQARGRGSPLTHWGAGPRAGGAGRGGRVATGGRVRGAAVWRWGRG